MKVAFEGALLREPVLDRQQLVLPVLHAASFRRLQAMNLKDL